MIRQLALWMAVGLVSVASSMGASAQEARLVMRAAVTQYQAGDFRGRDTTGMVRAELDGYIVYLGDVLLPLGEGSLLVAGVDEDPLTNRPKVSLELAGAEAERFAEITAERIGQAIAIVLDGRVLSAPTVQGRIPNGRVEITGDTWDEASELAAALRDATGARSLEDARRERQRAFRTEIDLTAPEGAAEAFVRAVGLEDWLTMGELFHPDSQRLLRDAAEQMLVVHADSVSRVQVSEDGYAMGAEQHTGRVYAVSDLLETDPSGQGMDALSDAQATTLLFALAREMRPEVPDFVVVGIVGGTDDMAYAVVDAGEKDSFGFDGMSQAKVLSYQRLGTSWRLLYSATGW